VKILKPLFAVLIALTLVACGSPELDTTSKATIKQSLATMSAELPKAQRAELKKAYAGLVRYEKQQKGEKKLTVKEHLNGLTAKEIIRAAKLLKVKL
jgi:hypothetical protein